MIGLSIFEIAKKEEVISNLVVLGDFFLAIIVIPAIIVFSIKGCWRYIDSKFDVNEDSKIYKFFTAISIILLFVPVFIFEYLPLLGISNSLFKNSDILGYYGAVIGGGVTVLGVYWTLNYESKKSKEDRKQELKNLIEERRRNSLPILRFKFLPEGFSPLDIKPDNVVRNAGPDELFKNYDIVLDTTDGSEKYSESSIHVYGDLTIKNVGLGVAIISDVKLIRTKPKYTEVKNTGTLELNNYLIMTDDKKTDDEETDDKASQTFRMSIRSDDLNENDTLQFTFMDLYSNEYFYNIPFRRIDFDYFLLKTKILEKDVEIIPNLVSTKN